ncbi:MAG TPA: cupredoxin domain-containing protein [Patescibacteria group bacterium]|nr:cupredoxin domain-containing protein [Patescibacteria group bacterium]
MKKKGILIGVIVGVVAIAFIVDLFVSQPNKKGSTVTPSSSSSSSGSSDSTATSNAVSIKDFAFSPTATTVKKGTTVTWTNSDTTSHTVAIDSGNGPKSGDIQPGGTYTYTFDAVGTFAYHCTFHPNMTATVKVTE